MDLSTMFWRCSIGFSQVSVEASPLYQLLCPSACIFKPHEAGHERTLGPTAQVKSLTMHFTLTPNDSHNAIICSVQVCASPEQY